jgi:peptidoglycan hydrolase CwlO-like protein
VYDWIANIPSNVSEVIFSGRSSAFIGELVEKVFIEELRNKEIIRFEAVQHSLNAELNRLIKDIEEEEAEHKRLTDELRELENEIERLETEDIEIKPF